MEKLYIELSGEIKKTPSDGASASIASSFGSVHELKYRRIWHLAVLQVAGLHRADPSTTLDKVWYEINIILPDESGSVKEPGASKSTEFDRTTPRVLVHNSENAQKCCSIGEKYLAVCAGNTRVFVYFCSKTDS